MRERLDTLHQMAQSLIQHETLESEALEILFQGLPPPPPPPPAAATLPSLTLPPSGSRDAAQSL